jgi:hypothetical protein
MAEAVPLRTHANIAGASQYLAQLKSQSADRLTADYFDYTAMHYDGG